MRVKERWQQQRSWQAANGMSGTVLAHLVLVTSLSLSPFYRWGNGGTEPLSNLQIIPISVSGKAMIRTLAVWFQSHTLNRGATISSWTPLIFWHPTLISSYLNIHMNICIYILDIHICIWDIHICIYTMSVLLNSTI